MNRLWVRLSLVYFLVIGFITLVPTTIAFLDDSDGPLAEITQLAQDGETDKIIAFVEEQRVGFGQLVSRFVIISGIVGLSVGVIFSRTLTRPLDRLKEATTKVQQKDFSVRVPTATGSDEVQALSNAFNDMAGQLEKAESLRKNLLSDVAHELRNPLHVIKGNIEAMIDGVFPRSDEELNRLLGQTELLTTLVGDLHELALAEANQLTLERQPTEVAKLLDEIVQGFQAAAAGKEIKLELALHGKLPTLELDRARMRQVFSNLLSNAIRYTPAQGKVSVAAEMIGTELLISVVDSGEGIEPENLPYIFDRFYRTDKARTREKGGTGLGLAIVKALVEAHGGSVSVSSEGVGTGTKFVVRLQ